MSNVIQFLEALGSNPALTKLSASEYAATVAALDADDAQRKALIDADQAALSGLLGGRQEMSCLVWPADEPTPSEDDQSGEEQPLEDAPETE